MPRWPLASMVQNTTVIPDAPARYTPFAAFKSMMSSSITLPNELPPIPTPLLPLYSITLSALAFEPPVTFDDAPLLIRIPLIRPDLTEGNSGPGIPRDEVSSTGCASADRLDRDPGWK
jgi:hypothetical protein